jgi:predicted PurR-regulated permease PerM
MKTNKQTGQGPRSRNTEGGPSRIPLSPRVLGGLIVLALVLLVLFLRAAPGVATIAVGGTALALILSLPVRWLSRLMPRGLAILVTVLLLLGVIVLALVLLLPILIEQLGGLISSIPGIASSLDNRFREVLSSLEDGNVLPVTSEEVISNITQDLFGRTQALAQSVLLGVTSFVSSVFNLVVLLFGIVFVAIYLLVDVRRIKAAYLRAIPAPYRRDAADLWSAFDGSLSRYLGGLAFVIVAQGVLSGLALWLLGVPYSLLLGAWVSATAIIPFLGAWLGAIPAMILALFESPAIALLTAIAFFVIQQFESNVLSPRVYGQAVRVHPILVLLAVVGGGQIAGLTGAILAVPMLAVSRVLSDFLRPRLYVRR